VESFRRDFVFSNNDNFLVFFDTFLDQTNGFTFGLSASGAKWDGVMHSGQGSNLNWDCKWESRVKHFDDRWTAEMRIPFKSIRYTSGGQIWNANFSRLDIKSDEKSSWAPVPRQFPTSSLAYAGIVRFEEPLPKSKMMLSLIPYIYGSYVENNETPPISPWKKDFGFDAKIGFSSSMNLDVTFNPDFAQVEVDQPPQWKNRKRLAHRFYEYDHTGNQGSPGKKFFGFICSKKGLCPLKFRFYPGKQRILEPTRKQWPV